MANHPLNDVLFPISTATENKLEDFTSSRFLQPKDIVHRQSTTGETSPHPLDGETIISLDALLRGLQLPPSRFFAELLWFYSTEIFNLDACIILFLAIFSHLCEAWLGIRPNLELWDNTSFLPSHQIANRYTLHFGPLLMGWKHGASLSFV